MSLPALEWLKLQLGVPAHAVFLGFGVHRPEPDAFLAASDPAAEPVSFKWSDSVERAHRFQRWQDVQQTAAALADCRIVLMFDYGDEIWVFPAR